jgi:chromosomal replication initiation ATPase DnaA
MEVVKDYYVEYLNIKRTFTKSNKLQTEEISKYKSKIMHLEREVYALRKQLREFKSVDKPTSWNQVIDNTCQVFAISREELMNRCRVRELVLARQLCFYILRNELNLTLVQIATLFKMHHSTIIHALTQAENYMNMPKLYNYEIEMFYKIKAT